MWLSAIFFSVLAFDCCNGIIYHLNETEHHRMPQLFDLDRYDSCLASDRGLYCVLRLDLFADANNQLMNLIKEYSAYTAKHYDYTYIERGVCVTETCKDFIKDKNLENSHEVQAVLEECLNTTIWEQYELQTNVTEVYHCDRPNEETDIDCVDWIVAGVILIFLLLVLLATLYDVLRTKTNLFKNNITTEEINLLMNFSLRKNWNDLVNSETSDPRRKILVGLRGVRSITNCLMIIAHVMFLHSAFIDSPHTVEKTYETFHYHLVYNGLMIVQIFFFMSAFLQSYLLHLRSEVIPFQWSELPMILFARRCRLTSAYAVLLAFSATWLRHLGAGPLWKLYVTNSLVAQCRRNWIYHLLYLNNYHGDENACELQTWHIAADMQMFVATMLVFFVTRSRGRNLGLGLLLVAGLAAPALHVWFQNLDALVLSTPQFYRRITFTPTFRLLHILGHNNLSCYVIGLTTGSLVYNLQKNNKWGLLSWCVIPAIACLFLTGRVFYAEGAGGWAARVLYAATHRLAMAALVAVLFLTLTMRLCESFCAFFEWRGWLVPSRLSYSVYLVHMNLVHVLLGVRTQLSTVSLFNILVAYFGILVMSVLIALPFHLIFEAPLTGLQVALLRLRMNIPTRTEINGKKIT